MKVHSVVVLQVLLLMDILSIMYCVIPSFDATVFSTMAILTAYCLGTLFFDAYQCIILTECSNVASVASKWSVFSIHSIIFVIIYK